MQKNKVCFIVLFIVLMFLFCSASFALDNFSVDCKKCPPEYQDLILSAADKTLKLFKEEFPWMSAATDNAHYLIEFDQDFIKKGKYYDVDYEKRLVRLSKFSPARVAHQVSHLLFADYFGMRKASPNTGVFQNCPAWFLEALCFYLEYRVDSSRRVEQNYILSEERDFLTLDKAILKSEKLAYAQAWNMLEYLIKQGGKRKLELLTRSIKESWAPVTSEKSWSKVFDEVYENSLGSWKVFYDSWISYHKDKIKRASLEF